MSNIRRASFNGAPKPPGGENRGPGEVAHIPELTRRKLAVLADIAARAKELDGTIDGLQRDAEKVGLDLNRVASRLEDIEWDMLDQAA